MTYLEEKYLREKPFLIQTKEIFGRFIAESIARAILGGSDKTIEILQIINFIDSDLTSFGGSVKLLLNSFMPKTFKFKIFRDEVEIFFKKTLIQEISSRSARGKTETNDLIQILVESLKEHEQEEEAISAQFLIFFVGG